ncbi:MAG: hypothetical protein OEW40_19400, partial [Cyclobacteriaceae bacterium]|nr:hypothetical protein [Cyclobacteriaceae bacterium]
NVRYTQPWGGTNGGVFFDGVPNLRKVNPRNKIVLTASTVITGNLNVFIVMYFLFTVRMMAAR